MRGLQLWSISCGIKRCSRKNFVFWELLDTKETIYIFLTSLRLLCLSMMYSWTLLKASVHSLSLFFSFKASPCSSFSRLGNRMLSFSSGNIINTKSLKLDSEHIIIDTMNPTAGEPSLLCCNLFHIVVQRKYISRLTWVAVKESCHQRDFLLPHPTSSSHQERGLHPASYCPFHLGVKVLCALCYQSF